MEQEQQEKYMKLQMLSQQMKTTQEQLGQLQNQEAQLTKTLETLDQFKESKVGSEAFVSLGTGIFTKAELKANNKLLVNVGAGVVVEKDVAGTKVLIEEQMKEISQVNVKLTQDLQKLAMEAHNIEHELAGTACNH